MDLSKNKKPFLLEGFIILRTYAQQNLQKLSVAQLSRFPGPHPNGECFAAKGSDRLPSVHPKTRRADADQHLFIARAV